MFYDEELMIKDLLAKMRSKLDGEITKINTEKNDSLVLDLIPDDKYVFQTLHKSLLNYKGFFILFGLVDVPVSEASTANEIQEVVISFEVATFDKGDKDLSPLFFKLLRYRRALIKWSKTIPMYLGVMQNR